MARVYDDSSNMDEEKNGFLMLVIMSQIRRRHLYRMEILQLFGRSSKGLQTEILMEMSSMPTLLLFSHIDHLKRMQIIKKL